MRRATATNPRSHSQPFLTLRATACTTRGTGCGTIGLFGFDIPGSVPAGFVAEHRSKRRPRCIKRRFPLRSIRHRCGIYVADHHQLVLSHEIGRLHMQIVSTCVRDLGMDRPRALLVPGPLCNRERGLIALEVPWIRNFATIRQRRQRRQTKIDADFARATILLLGNLNLHRDIPSATPVLRKTTGLDRSVDWPAIPESIATLEINHGIAVYLDGTGGGKRNPAEAFLATPSRAALRCISARRKLFADRLHRVAVQTKQHARPGAELDQIKCSRPWLVVAA